MGSLQAAEESVHSSRGRFVSVTGQSINRDSRVMSRVAGESVIDYLVACVLRLTSRLLQLPSESCLARMSVLA
jgi:hypothetical protein